MVLFIEARILPTEKLSDDKFTIIISNKIKIVSSKKKKPHFKISFFSKKRKCHG